MNRWKDIDPDAGDKAWDRIKERDLEEWHSQKLIRDYERETEILKCQTQMLASILKGMRQ
jgi:hypothetical protein